MATEAELDSLIDRSELEVIEDDLFAHLKKQLADGDIKSTDSKLLLELTERRAGRVPKGPPVEGLLVKLPFENGEPLTK